jgi:hypothetical protein
VDDFTKAITGQLWRVEALLLVCAILAGVMVGLATYGHHYRHYSFTRYLLLGATTLFLPKISYVLSGISSIYTSFGVSRMMSANCENLIHSYLVILSTSLCSDFCYQYKPDCCYRW